MQVGPCSPLAKEEKSSQEDKAEFSFMLTSYTSHTFPSPRTMFLVKGDKYNHWHGYQLTGTEAGWSWSLQGPCGGLELLDARERVRGDGWDPLGPYVLRHGLHLNRQ